MKSFEQRLYERQLVYWLGQDTAKQCWLDERLTTISKWLAEELKKVQFNSIYEVGVGCGRNLFYINNAFPDIRMGGNDINASALAFAKNILPDDCALEYFDAVSIDTSDRYDVVFTHNLLMHLPSKHVSMVVNNCLDKAARYIIHIEKAGPARIYKGPQELDPIIVSDELLWTPDVANLYTSRMDCSVVTSKDKEVESGNMVRLIVVEKKLDTP